MTHALKQFIIRGLKWSLLCLGVILLGLLMINAYVIGETKDQIKTADSIGDFDPDCILVLGAGVWANDVPSPILRDRLDKAIELSKLGIETTLLMSGDHGQVDYDEVNVMKAYAIDQGLMSSDIFMDHAGFSTYESLARAKLVFGVKKVIIVTQKQHLYRALYIARSLGLEAIGIPAQEIAYGGDLLRDIRESLARVKDVFTSLVKPMPMMGDFIPITGNGDVTNDK